MNKEICFFKDIVKRYNIHEIADYINWIYFFHAWSFPMEFASVAKIHECCSCRKQWVDAFEEKDRCKASEAIKLYDAACLMLSELESKYSVRALFRLYDACSDGDDLICGGVRVPMLRQQKAGADGYCLCLSDYVPPAEMNLNKYVGIFVASADEALETLYEDDVFNKLLVRTLADRLAEAATECLHEEVRKSIWGYAPDEKLSMDSIHREEFQGIRPAVGYPCLPDVSLNFILNELLDFSRIGVSLTETGMMRPHASVCGLMFDHPKARYFSVGNIGEDQLADYAQRRGMDIEEMRTYLARNLE